MYGVKLLTNRIERNIIMTLQDLINYANEKGFDPSECTIKAETYDNANLYDVTQDIDEVFEPMIVLGFYP